MLSICFYFQEFLFFILPLVNFQRIKNYVIKKLVLTASKQKLSQDAPRDLTSCAICSNWPIRPQEIGCQHVFCYFCIQVNRFVIDFFSSPEHKVLRVSYCDRPLSVVRKLVYLNIIFSETPQWILTKLNRNDPWVVPYQNCLNGSDWLHK